MCNGEQQHCTGNTTAINDDNVVWDIATAAVARDLVGSIMPMGGDALLRKITTTNQDNNIAREGGGGRSNATCGVVGRLL